MDKVVTGTESVSRGRRVAFAVLVVLFALLLLSPMSPLVAIVLGWFLVPAETGGVSHRVHDLSFGAMFALSFVGAVAQLRRPERKVAPMQQAIIPIVILIIVETAISGLDPELVPMFLMFLVPPILIALLHPARREVFRPEVDPSPVLLTLVALAAVPLLVFAVGEIRTGDEGVAIASTPPFEALDALPDETTEEEFEAAFQEAVDEAGLSPELQEAVEHFFHWPGMAAFAFIIVALGLVAAMRVRGWRLTAWSTGLALAYFGLASVLTPDDASSGGYVWGGLAILWGVAFLVATERQARAAREPVRRVP